MTISGDWILHYSWGCNNNYSQTKLTFNANRTFSGSYTGRWRELNGTLMLAFDGGPAIYGGDMNGNIGSGIMSTFTGLDGCWYLSLVGTVGILPEAAMEAGGAAQPAAADGTVTKAAMREFPSQTVSEERELVGAGTRRGGGGRSGTPAKKTGNSKRK